MSCAIVTDLAMSPSDVSTAQPQTSKRKLQKHTLRQRSITRITTQITNTPM